MPGGRNAERLAIEVPGGASAQFLLVTHPPPWSGPPEVTLTVDGKVRVAGKVGVAGTVGVTGPVTTQAAGTPFQVTGSYSTNVDKVLGTGKVAITGDMRYRYEMISDETLSGGVQAADVHVGQPAPGPHEHLPQVRPAHAALPSVATRWARLAAWVAAASRTHAPSARARFR